MTIEFAVLVPVLVVALIFGVSALASAVIDMRARVLVDLVAQQLASGRIASTEREQLQSLGRVQISESSSEICVRLDSAHRWVGGAFVSHSRAQTCRSVRP